MTNGNGRNGNGTLLKVASLVVPLIVAATIAGVALRSNFIAHAGDPDIHMPMEKKLGKFPTRDEFVMLERDISHQLEAMQRQLDRIERLLEAKE